MVDQIATDINIQLTLAALNNDSGIMSKFDTVFHSDYYYLSSDYRLQVPYWCIDKSKKQFTYKLHKMYLHQQT